MNRIDQVLGQLRVGGKKMLSPYLTAGDPHPELTVPLMHELVRAGADILELGIPFSDPMAEGPVIQAAMERALSHDISCDKVLAMVEKFREQDQLTPIVLMGYVNPIEQYGYEAFAKRARQVGVDGTILVDLPPEENEVIVAPWQRYDLYSIYLCSPTTSDKRMARINQAGKGYLYYVSLKGVTGADSLDLQTVRELYQYRKLQTNLPLMVGFGVKTAAMAAEVAQFADGVIVGAALISRLIEAYQSGDDVLAAGASLLRAMRQATDLNNE